MHWGAGPANQRRTTNCPMLVGVVAWATATVASAAETNGLGGEQGGMGMVEFGQHWATEAPALAYCARALFAPPPCTGRRPPCYAPLGWGPPPYSRMHLSNLAYGG